jgi:hypothetical protein
LAYAVTATVQEEGRVVLVRVVGNALRAGDGEEVDEGLVSGEGV